MAVSMTTRHALAILLAFAGTASAMADGAKDAIYVYQANATKYSAAYNLLDAPVLRLNGDNVTFSVGGVEKKTITLADGLTIKLGNAFVKGDVDNDGAVTMSDANIVANHYLGVEKEINEVAADMDDDGAIGMADANAIVNTYLQSY